MVSNVADFNGTMKDGCIFDIMAADDYVAKVFVPECLPSVISAKSFLMIALDL